MELLEINFCCICFITKKKKELKRVEDSAQASGFGAIEESNMPQLKEKKKEREKSFIRNLRRSCQ